MPNPKSKNLFFTPSVLAVYLLLIPPANDLINQSLDNKKIDPKAFIGFLSLVATVVIQNVLRYNENEETNFYTPMLFPGKDKPAEDPVPPFNPYKDDYNVK
jgi:hypothetical protein